MSISRFSTSLGRRISPKLFDPESCGCAQIEDLLTWIVNFIMFLFFIEIPMSNCIVGVILISQVVQYNGTRGG